MAPKEHHGLRAALRFADEPNVETILREVIANAEDRLIELERPEQPKNPEAPKYPSALDRSRCPALLGRSPTLGAAC